MPTPSWVILDDNQNVITVFGCAQNPPTQPGYTVIDADDLRIAAFFAAQNQDPASV